MSGPRETPASSLGRERRDAPYGLAARARALRTAELGLDPRPFSRPASRPAKTEVAPIIEGYRLGAVLGRGGTSTVYEAAHAVHSPSRPSLAVKVVTDARLAGDVAARAIVAHANLIATLASPHVVRVLDAGRLATGEPFIVMERLGGEDLAEHLRARGALPVTEVVRLLAQVCHGLAAAHARGLVHGDLKPANLTRVAATSGGRAYVKVIDFGTSVPSPDAPGKMLVTGSPGYAAPEQLDPHGVVDARADVWAVGVVLYELVTGQRAFDVTTLAEAQRVSRQLPPMTSPHGPVPRALEEILAGCLAVEPTARFTSAADLGAAFTSVLVGGPSMTTSPAAIRRARRAPTQLVRTARTPAPAPSPSTPFVARARDLLRTPRLPPSLRLPALLALGPIAALIAMGLVRLALHGSLLDPPSPPPAAELVAASLAAR